MGKEEVLATRYARGLAEYAQGENRLEEVRRDMASLGALLESGGEDAARLADFFNSPTLAPERKREMADTITKATGVGEAVAGLLQLLVRKNRMALFPWISRIFAELSGEMTGESIAIVETARPLTDSQTARLAAALESAVGGKVSLHQKVVPGLLAGARVLINGTLLDGTVLGKLEDMRRGLAAERTQ